VDALYQRLKEMDPDTFQRFCFQLLKEQCPGLELKHVDGKGGDEGIDVFAGELSNKLAIWQPKNFVNGIGDPQKAQIKQSLKTALEHFSPSLWTLCLPVDMDTKTRRWFEELKKSHESKVVIADLSASEIVHELIHRRSLRNHFFPGAAIDPIELKRLIAKSGEMSVEELEQITDANVEDVIERWKERDARFNYQLVFDGDLGPLSSRSNQLQPGLVMSMWREGKTVNVFARDVASLRANPPKFHTTFKGAGVQKYRAFIKTGVPQEFEPDELGPFETDWLLMKSVEGPGRPHKLSLAPSPALTNKKAIVRLEFVGKDAADVVRYEAMELRPVRGGVEELEFSISGKNVPFTLSVVLSLPGPDASFTVHFDGTQRDPRIIKKSLEALNLLRPSGTLRILELESEKLILDSTSSLPDETPQQAARRAFVNDVVAIADRFGADLRMPDKVSEEDLRTIFLLKLYMTQGTIDFDIISTVIVKREENRNLLREFPNGRMSFGFVNKQLEPVPRLFGTDIKTGPVVVLGEAEINGLSATLQAFERAPIGSDVEISLKPLGPVRLALSSAETENLGLKLDSTGKSTFLFKKGD